MEHSAGVRTGRELLEATRHCRRNQAQEPMVCNFNFRLTISGPTGADSRLVADPRALSVLAPCF